MTSGEVRAAAVRDIPLIDARGLPLSFQVDKKGGVWVSLMRARARPDDKEYVVAPARVPVIKERAAPLRSAGPGAGLSRENGSDVLKCFDKYLFV